jgi:UDP-N-acetylmuramate dehydrogenase
MLAGVTSTTEQVRLADYTTLRLGGPAAQFVEAASREDLIEAVRAADAEPEPVLVLGGGSNLVVADEGFPGVVVLAACRGLDFAAAGDAVVVTADAGQDWDELVQQCVAAGLSGVECLSGIPGRAGATPIQNVGAYGQEVAQTITEVRAYDRLADRVVRLSAADCEFGYRTSMFKRQATASARPGRGTRGAALNPATATGRFVMLGVTFRLTASPLSGPVRYGELSRVLGVAEGGQVPLVDARAAVLELRRGKGMLLDDTDPDTRSAGSFFTNPIVTAEQYAQLAARAAAGAWSAASAGNGHGGAAAGARSAASAGNGQGSAVIPHWPEADGRVKLSAAWLIEHAGFSRGFQLTDDPDGARISTKHTLALTNPGGGTTTSLIRLARQIRDGVRTAFGVDLVNEPTLVGVEL